MVLIFNQLRLRVFLRHGCALVCVLLLAGCAQGRPFQEPITNFAAASGNAATSFVELDKAAAAAESELRLAEVIKGNLIIRKKGCVTTADRCILFYQGTDRKEKEVYVASLMPQSVLLMTSIKEYAKALSTLEKADASADVEAAFTQTLDSIKTIATVINLPAAAAIAAVAKPAASVFGWGFVQYQNSLKYKALRDATMVADPYIKDAARFLGDALELAYGAQLAELEISLVKIERDSPDNPTVKSVKAQIQAARALDDALEASRPELFKRMADSHEKLAAAIANPKGGLTELATAIKAFATQAGNVQKIATQLDSSAPTVTK